MISLRDILQRVSVRWQNLLEVVDHLIGGLTVPDSVTGQYNELNVLVEWLHNHVGVGSHHVVVQKPSRLCVFWRGDGFVVKIADCS